MPKFEELNVWLDFLDKEEEDSKANSDDLTFGTQTIKHRWAHGLVGFANGAGAGKATLENGSFDDCEAKREN